MTTNLRIDTAKLRRQLNRAQVDGIASGHPFDPFRVRPVGQLVLVADNPTEIVLEADMVGWSE